MPARTTCHRRSIIRRPFLRRLLFRVGVFVILTGILLVALSGCSPFYVMRAAYEEGKILANRQVIEKVIKEDVESEEILERLRYVLAARNFALRIGLDPGESFTRYTRVDRDVMVWVLLGARRDSFQMHTWWYPIVGTVPYKGFFDREDALEGASSLEDDGFETWVRGSEAFSTLGWFNDPVLSTTLRHHPSRIVNTVLHETFHQTVWLPGHVDFNETAANFVGLRGAIDFFAPDYLSSDECPGETYHDLTVQLCSDTPATYLSQADRNYHYEQKLADAIDGLHRDLSELYKSDLSSDKKISQREEIFQQHISALRAQYPKMQILKKLNNAEIMQLRLYLTGFDRFAALFQAVDEQWSDFLSALKAVQTAVENDSSTDPFEKLEQEIAARVTSIHPAAQTENENG